MPTTVEGVEAAIVLVLIGLWALNVLQLSLASPTAIEHSTDPQGSALLIAIGLGRLAVWGVVVVRSRNVAVTWAIVTDVAFGAALLIVQSRLIEPSLYHSWGAWAYAITVSCAFWAGIGLTRMWQSMLAGLVCMAAYLVGILPGSYAAGDPVTPITNSAAYLAFAVLGHAGARYLRRLATDADRARIEAASTARELERDRHRRLLHDQATVLQLLARGESDPDLELALRRQAAVGAAEIRVFLSGPPRGRSGARDLATVVRGAARPFSDLPLTLNVELGDEVSLDPGVSRALSRALATVFHNVRVHAQAQSVVVHADSLAGEWEVVIRDDGVGFNLDTTPLGFGLGEQVVAALNEHGCRVALDSVPGEGTTVTLGGLVSPSPRLPGPPGPLPAGAPGQQASDLADSSRTSG